MKNLICALVIIGILFTSIRCSDADASKPKPILKEVETTSGDAETLKEFGFTNIGSVSIAMKKKYMDKYGLNYITDSEMDSIVKVNNFIVSQAQTYIGTIPSNIAKTIIANYKKIESEKRFYMESGLWWTIGYAGSTDKGIFVAAPKEYFVAGSANRRPDPIIVVKIQNAWIELARW